MSHVNYKNKIETDLICIMCSPPHIKGVCNCKTPKYIPIVDWLEVDRNGNRAYLNKYSLGV